MEIDSSILVALMMEEAGFEELVITIGESETRVVSVATYLEASMVLISKLGPDTEARYDLMLQQSEIVLVPVSVVQAQIDPAGVSPLWQGPAPCRSQFWRLVRVCLVEIRLETFVLQGK